MTRNELFSPLCSLSRAPEDGGALYNLAANRRTALDEVVNDLILGSCALFFPRAGRCAHPAGAHGGEALRRGSRRTSQP